MLIYTWFAFKNTVLQESKQNLLENHIEKHYFSCSKERLGINSDSYFTVMSMTIKCEVIMQNTAGKQGN